MDGGDRKQIFLICINLPIPTNAILHDEVIVKVSDFSQFR